MCEANFLSTLKPIQADILLTQNILAVILGNYGLECARRTICPRNVKIYTADTLLTTKNMLQVILETYGLWNELLNLRAEHLCNSFSRVCGMVLGAAGKINRGQPAHGLKMS